MGEVFLKWVCSISKLGKIQKRFGINRKQAWRINVQPSCLCPFLPSASLWSNIILLSRQVINPSLDGETLAGAALPVTDSNCCCCSPLTESYNDVHLDASQGLVTASSDGVNHRCSECRKAKLKQFPALRKSAVRIPLAAFSQQLTKMLWEPREMRRLCLRAVCWHIIEVPLALWQLRSHTLPFVLGCGQLSRMSQCCSPTGRDAFSLCHVPVLSPLALSFCSECACLCILNLVYWAAEKNGGRSEDGGVMMVLLFCLPPASCVCFSTSSCLCFSTFSPSLFQRLLLGLAGGGEPGILGRFLPPSHDWWLMALKANILSNQPRPNNCFTQTHFHAFNNL